MAASASWLLLKVTKPKPRERPVSRSRITIDWREEKDNQRPHPDPLMDHPSKRHRSEALDRSIFERVDDMALRDHPRWVRHRGDG